MKYIIFLSVLLTGCATNAGECTSHCVAGFGPGNSLFEMIARHYDSMDSCQMTGKPDDYKLPSFCMNSPSKQVQYVYDKNGRRIATIK